CYSSQHIREQTDRMIVRDTDLRSDQSSNVGSASLLHGLEGQPPVSWSGPNREHSETSRHRKGKTMGVERALLRKVTRRSVVGGLAGASIVSLLAACRRSRIDDDESED